MRHKLFRVDLILPFLSAALLLTTTVVRASQADHDVAAIHPTSDDSLSLQKIEEIALKEVPGGRVISIERDIEWGHSVFEVEMIDREGWELELTIDATSGRVLRRQRDD